MVQNLEAATWKLSLGICSSFQKKKVSHYSMPYKNMFICQAIRKLMYETSFKPKLLSTACFLRVYHIHLNMYGFDKEEHQNL